MAKRNHDSSVVKLRGPFTPTIVVGDVTWTAEERLRLAEGLTSCAKYKRFSAISKHVKTKSNLDVKDYVDNMKKIEACPEAKEFKGKAPIDVWINISQAAAHPEDCSASICVPQVMTVAGLEPGLVSQDPKSPNFAAVYNFLGHLLKGDPLPDLEPLESKVVLGLMEDLVKKLSTSDTHVQGMQIQTTYELLMKYLDETEQSEASRTSLDVEASKKSRTEDAEGDKSKAEGTVELESPLATENEKNATRGDGVHACEVNDATERNDNGREPSSRTQNKNTKTSAVDLSKTNRGDTSELLVSNKDRNPLRGKRWYHESVAKPKPLQKFPSLNPLGIPSQCLPFKWKTQVL